MNTSLGAPLDNYVCRVSAGGEVTQLTQGNEFVIENDRIYYTKTEYTYDDLGNITEVSTGAHSMKLNVDNAGESRLVQETSGTQVYTYMMLDDYIFYVYHYEDGEDNKRNLVIEKYDGSEKNESYMGDAAGAF